MKNITKQIAAIALLFTAPFAFSASIQSLNETETKHTISDKTIQTIPLVTLDNQLTENTFTGFFNKNGTAQGKLATKPSTNMQTDQGTWTVKNDGALCVTWDHWNNHQQTCVVIYKIKNGIIFVNQETKKFESMVLQDNIKSGNQIS